MSNSMVNKEYGFWESSERRKRSRDRYFDEGLSGWLLEFFTRKKKNNPNFMVGDFGCGNGAYAKVLNNSGIKCFCCDGNPNTGKITECLCETRNLAVKQDFPVCNWITCLEVAEHIPPEFEHVLLDNLHRHNTDGIIISWARRGQRGRGHVNCKDPEEVESIFTGMGYKKSGRLSRSVKRNANIRWFKKNTMVFIKNKDSVPA